MAKELAGQVEGVGPLPLEGEQATAGEQQQEQAGVAGQPTTDGGPAIAEGQVPGQQKPVDLTQMEEFRRWQAARDRREAQLQQQLDEGQRQAQELKRQVEQLQLADADPEQVATYYQQQLAKMQEEQAQRATMAQQRQTFVTEAGRLLEELGLASDTPGLEWSEEPSAEGLARLAASAAKIKALQVQQIANESQAVTDQAAQAAKVEALNAAGVTKVNTATGVAAPKDLQAEYDAEKAKLRGTGDVGALTRLKTKYRKEGLEV